MVWDWLVVVVVAADSSSEGGVAAVEVVVVVVVGIVEKDGKVDRWVDQEEALDFFGIVVGVVVADDDCRDSRHYSVVVEKQEEVVGVVGVVVVVVVVAVVWLVDWNIVVVVVAAEGLNSWVVAVVAGRAVAAVGVVGSVGILIAVVWSSLFRLLSGQREGRLSRLRRLLYLNPSLSLLLLSVAAADDREEAGRNRQKISPVEMVQWAFLSA